jgi:myosin heavy subunit
MQRALDVLGFTADEKMAVYTIVAALLWLGQIRLIEAGADACMVDGMIGNQLVAKLIIFVTRVCRSDQMRQPVRMCRQQIH